MVNAAAIRRREQKAQKQKLTERDQKFSHAKAPQDRPPATSDGIRQAVSLAKLPTIGKTITLRPEKGEVELCWRLKMDDVRALKMVLLIYEANGWKVK